MICLVNVHTVNNMYHVFVASLVLRLALYLGAGAVPACRPSPPPASLPDSGVPPTEPKKHNPSPPILTRTRSKKNPSRGAPAPEPGPALPNVNRTERAQKLKVVHGAKEKLAMKRKLRDNCTKDAKKAQEGVQKAEAAVKRAKTVYADAEKRRKKADDDVTNLEKEITKLEKKTEDTRQDAPKDARSSGKRPAKRSKR